MTEHIHPLDTLEPLRDVVSDARVVAIGESTHRVHEFYEIRHSVTRFLVEEGGSSTVLPGRGGPTVRGRSTLYAYMALPAAHRYELTARTNELTERLQAMADPAASRALQNAITARHADAFLANMALGEERTYRGANMRDAAMADNIKWILEREERIVIGAANGHIQRWPYRVPPIINDDQTMLGQHLATLGADYVPIATTFNGGRMFLHRPIPDGPPGHTEIFYENIGPFTDENALDTFMARACHERSLLNLRTAPELPGIDAIMTGPHPQPVNPKAAFDAVIHVGAVTPWHTFLTGAPK